MFKQICFFKKHSGMSLDAFKDYYENQHSQLSKRMGRSPSISGRTFTEMARYSGQDDVKDAANWSCPEDDTSLLKLGKSGKLEEAFE